jgi:Kdo2-lipid IVA lauroyltransferase/acyltransferase
MNNLSFYLNPLYWPLWFLIGILWSIARLPYAIQLKLGCWLGRLIYCLPTKVKLITETNIKLCFPELSIQEQRALIKNNFENLGIGLLETGMAWWLPNQKLKPLLHIQGIEHAEKALSKGKGIILLSPHFTCLEMIGRLIAMHYAFTALYRPHKKKFIAFLLERFRGKQQVTYIPYNRMRKLTSALLNNQPVWYAYDVDGGKKRSVFAPFFGTACSSLTAISRLVKLTGAAVIPIHFFRRDDNSGYEIVLAPALKDFPTEDPVLDATVLNQCLEKAIRQKPEQYIWQYKRFKTRPEREKRFYE